MKKYNIILADPPWRYDDPANAGKRGVCHKYSTLGYSELADLSISTIADENCVLFLWVTMPMLRQATTLIFDWGFQYKTCAFSWVKTKKNNDKNVPIMTMGNYTRANVELCLLGTKGRLERQSKSVSQVIMEPRGIHSEKPFQIYDRIYQLYGDLPRIELFARNRVPGWDAIGYELDGKDIREVFK